MSYKCRFCDDILSTESALSDHMNSNRACLTLRRKTIYKCYYCDYITWSKFIRVVHMETCKYKFGPVESIHEKKDL